MSLHSRIRRETAVDGNDHAGHEAAEFLVRKPQESAHELSELAESAHRRMRNDLVRTGRELAFLVIEKGTVLIAHEKAGRYRVDADTHAGEMHGEPFGEIGHRRFSGAVGGYLRQRTESVHTADIDDGATRLDHSFRKSLRSKQNGREIEVEKLSYGVAFEAEKGFYRRIGNVAFFVIFFVRRRGGMIAARAVYKHIHTAEILDDLLVAIVEARPVEHVREIRARYTAVLVDLVGDFARAVEVDVDESDFCAYFGEFFGKTGTYSSRGARKGDGLITQIDIISLHIFLLRGRLPVCSKDTAFVTNAVINNDSTTFFLRVNGFEKTVKIHGAQSAVV